MSSRKGISDIITIIIILLVAVSLAGGFFLWAGRSVESLQEGAGEQINQSAVSLGQKLRIESADGINDVLSVRNFGSSPVDVNTILVTVDGGRESCADWEIGGASVTQIPPNRVAQCIGGLPDFTCASGEVVTVSTSGGEDSVECSA